MAEPAMWATQILLSGGLDGPACLRSSTGTDSDFVVKLIDVYPNDYPDPQPNPKGVHMGGYQQLVRGEPFRGKFREGFERSLSYTYIRRGRKVIKTVTYFLVEVRDVSTLACSAEHAEDPFGYWCFWGSFEQVSKMLYHSKIRQVFAEANAWLGGSERAETSRSH